MVQKLLEISYMLTIFPITAFDSASVTDSSSYLTALIATRGPLFCDKIRINLLLYNQTFSLRRILAFGLRLLLFASRTSFSHSS